MTAAKRRLNFTGRKRITRDHVDIVLLPLEPGGSQLANITIDLKGTSFPSTAEVILEAYHRSSGQRFPLGTVGNLSISNPIAVNEIDLNGSILFRLQIVDRALAIGKVLGSAERLRPRSGDDNNKRRSLLPIRETDLQEDIWNLEIDEAGPELLLNYQVPGFKQRVLESPLLLSVLLPMALRIILKELAADPVVDDDDPEDWKGLWLRFVADRLNIEDDLTNMSRDEKETWVNSCVQEFCRSRKFVEHIRQEMDRQL